MDVQDNAIKLHCTLFKEGIDFLQDGRGLFHSKFELADTVDPQFYLI